MKVVILDDEEKVSNLICTLIDWEELGLTLAGTAADGLSGLELIKKVQPDLLITDIRMPGMDGLQLIEAVKKILPDLQIVLISGYSQFDYAQTAIRCGVVNYLLKPVKKQELNDTLRKMAAEFSKRSQQLSHTQQMEEQIKNIAREKQQEALCAVVNGGGELSAADIALPFPVAVTAVKIDGRSVSYDLKAAHVLSNRYKEYLSDTVQQPFVCISLDSLLITAVGNMPAADVFCETLLGWCKEQVELFRNFTLTVAQGSIVKKETEYCESIHLAMQGTADRLIKEPLCIYSEKVLQPRVKYDCTVPVKTMMTAMIQDNRSKFTEIFSQFRTSLSENSVHPYQLIIVIEEFKNQILEEARLQLDDEAYQKVEQKRSLIDMAGTIEILWQNILEFLNSVYDAVVNSNREKYVRPVREAQQYIHDHFNDSQLSLNSVAEYVGLNGNYFSGLFKKIVLSDLLIICRICG